MLPWGQVTCSDQPALQIVDKGEAMCLQDFQLMANCLGTDGLG